MRFDTLRESDYLRLAALATAVGRGTRPERARFLAERLERVLMLDEAGIDDGRATIGSEVRLRDLRGGEPFAYRLSLPQDADISLGRISVLTPLGAALLGRLAGDSFDYECPGGRIAVVVEEVRHGEA